MAERIAPVYDMRVYAGPGADAPEMHLDVGIASSALAQDLLELLLQRLGGESVLVQGLQTGDKVITSRIAELREGVAVTLEGAAPASR
mgnify:CR=1 FL=1